MASSNVEISNTAINMISTMTSRDKAHVDEAIQRVVVDGIPGPNSRPLKGYRDVFVLREEGFRIIYKVVGDKIFVTTVSKDK